MTTKKPPARLVRKALAELTGHLVDQEAGSGEWYGFAPLGGWYPIKASLVATAEAKARELSSTASKPLRGRGGASTLGGSSNGAKPLGRKRIREPDASTPSGQCALYLQHLTRDTSLDSLAETIGVSRATMFNYLAGVTEPSSEMRDKLAKALGLKDYRSLMPPDEFLTGLRRSARRKR